MISPQWALLAGILLSFFIDSQNNIKANAKSWGSKLLQASIILLGSALNFSSVLHEGTKGIAVTFVSIAFVFILGYAGIKSFKLNKELGLLITMGTAICGGSAIGALAPVIAADSFYITVSMAVVFCLNAASIFIFPPIGNFLHLSQGEFGLWAALAVHDTSSVVAVSSLYGNEALSVVTTVKLTRALWIIPIVLIFSVLSKAKEKKVSYPWFVAGFAAMSLAFTFIPFLEPLKPIFLTISKSGFAVTLFLIGLSFDYKKMKTIGLKPFLFGIILWMIVTGGALFYVSNRF